jgi:hypothetical protein
MLKSLDKMSIYKHSVISSPTLPVKEFLNMEKKEFQKSSPQQCQHYLKTKW